VTLLVCAQVAALLADRLAMVADADSRVDWAMAEALALGTLLLHRWAAVVSSASPSSTVVFC
jgi:2-oxoglutarate dehydrogenase complex dehydrogenase (E1) component-like enzyme